MVGGRIVVVGNTGSGKTTLAQELGRRLDLPHTELDALHWEPNWTPVGTAVFLKRVSEALNSDKWVIDGNYSQVRHLIWRRAETLIWLDYPLPIILWRLLRRSLWRAIIRQELWNGNQETLRSQFFSRDSLFIWALKKHWSRRRQFPQLFQQPAYAHLSVIHLRSHRQTLPWLSTLERYA